MTTESDEGPRARMVDAASRLLRTRGLAATSVRDIVELAGAPWGSVGHYFPGGKTQLVVEALQRGHERTVVAINACFTRSRSPARAIRRFFDGGIAVLEESDFAFGCPVATVAAETAGRDDEIARECIAALTDWHAAFAAGYRTSGLPARRAAELAAVTLQQYEGAILLSRVHRSAEPMRTASRTVQALLKQPA